MNKENENMNTGILTAIAANQSYAQPSIQLFNCDNLKLMAKMGDESVDVILTDPPYLYLKKQKLERYFDEELFFSECKRILTDKGFIVLFGRGESFYRWNTILADLGFVFKEEIVWNKMLTSSPVLKISRKHETISIFSKGFANINRVKINFFEKNEFDIPKVLEVVNRIKTTFGNRKTFDLLEKYFKNKHKEYTIDKEKFNITKAKNNKSINRTIQFVATMEEGVTEQSIIDIPRDHYDTIHPTQKLVRLLERLLSLVIPKDKAKGDIVVLDPFGGSFSTMEAVYNMQMKGISCEIDREYFEAGKNRIEKLPPRQTALFD